MSTVRIERRFRGPPTSGNGGYVAGLVAAALGGSNCVVTLKQPPPLDQDLSLKTTGDSTELFAEDNIIVAASREPVVIDVPDPPSFIAAEEAEPRFVGHSQHFFPGCFVCGPERESGDGLRIFPGRLNDRASQVAATWVPGDSVAGDDGMVRPEFIWAALDCPGYFAVEPDAGMAVLGKMSATIKRPVRIGERLIVTGWPIESSGRKHHVGSALHDLDGQLVAAARATWITLKETPA